VKIKISGTHQDKCNICNKEKHDVVTFGDEESKKTVNICRSCANSIGETSPEKLIEKHGILDEEPFKNPVRIEKKMQAG